MRRLASLLCLSLVVAGACGDDPDPTPSGDELRGELTVFAAASLTEAFTDAKRTLEADHPGLSITFNFAGSQALVQQILQGAPADVVAIADTTTMQQLTDGGLLDEGGPSTLAHNTLAIAVAPGNPKGVNGLADLARSDLVVVLAHPSVPVGGYAAASLKLAGVTVKARSLELDVKAALAKVTLGEADAAIVYRTDVLAAGDRADEVAIPDPVNQFVSYPIAVLEGTRHLAAARALLIELTDGAGRRSLLARGFRP